MEDRRAKDLMPDQTQLEVARLKGISLNEMIIQIIYFLSSR